MGNELENRMSNIVLVGKDLSAFAAFITELSEQKGVDVVEVTSGSELLVMVDSEKIDVVVLAEELGDGSAMSFVEGLIKKQPLINCAMMSSLDPEDFHEETEGLGIFMQLPVCPGAEEAVNMLEYLKSIDALFSS